MMKLKISNFFLFFIFLFSTVYIREILFLFYNSTESPDFDKYYDYIEYFYGSKISTGRDQGLLYYYLQAQYLSLFSNSISESNLSIYLSRSVQDINLVFHLIGLSGIYKLFRLFSFNKVSIFTSLIFLNFFPLSISNRITFKPEILAFAFLPWIIYCFECYKSEKSIKYIYFSIPLIVSTITSKGSILGMVGLFLFITYFKQIFNFSRKQLISTFLIFFILLFLVSFEDIKSNDVSLLDVTHDEKYNNRANIRDIYNINFVKLIKSPIRDNHAGSMPALTLLDIFGDYLNLYWDNDATSLKNNREDVFLFKESSKIQGPKFNTVNNTITIYFQNLTDVYFREFIGLMFSLLYLALLIRHIYFKKKHSTLVLAPIYGIVVLLIMTVIGFPVPNWDPLVGDTIKPFYYSFFIFVSIATLIATSINKKYLALVFLIFYIPASMYLIGFPKNYDQDSTLYTFNQYSHFCNINPYLFNGLNEFDKDKCDFKDEENKAFKNEEYLKFKNPPKFKLVNTLLIILTSFSLGNILRSKPKL